MRGPGQCPTKDTSEGSTLRPETSVLWLPLSKMQAILALAAVLPLSSSSRSAVGARWGRQDCGGPISQHFPLFTTQGGTEMASEQGHQWALLRADGSRAVLSWLVRGMYRHSSLLPSSITEVKKKCSPGSCESTLLLPFSLPQPSQLQSVP